MNGEPIEVTDGITVEEIVAARVPSHRGIAVAVNAEVVPRSTWVTAVLHDGDRVEVLSPAQGG